MPPRRVALMFRPGEAADAPDWLITLPSEVPAYRQHGWFLLVELDDTPPPRPWFNGLRFLTGSTGE